MPISNVSISNKPDIPEIQLVTRRKSKTQRLPVASLLICRKKLNIQRDQCAPMMWIVAAVRACKMLDSPYHLVQVIPALSRHGLHQARVRAVPKIVRRLIQSQPRNRSADLAFHGYVAVLW